MELKNSFLSTYQISSLSISVLMLFMGGMLYLLFRDNSLLMFEWVKSVGMNTPLVSVVYIPPPSTRLPILTWRLPSLSNVSGIIKSSTFLSPFLAPHDFISFGPTAPCPSVPLPPPFSTAEVCSPVPACCSASFLIPYFYANSGLIDSMISLIISSCDCVSPNKSVPGILAE